MAKVDLALIKRQVRDPLKRVRQFYRDSYFKWRYVDNVRPLLSYKLSHPPIMGEAARVVTELNNNGMAITTASALFGDDDCFNELCAEVERIEADRADQIAHARAQAHTVAEHKTFLFPLLGEQPVFDPTGIFVRIALQPAALNIANAYFGMYTKLRFYNVWRTFATRGPARRSQWWHHDPEDRYILKMFVYLSDVDDGAGPFTYASGSHPKGGLKVEPDYFREPNRKAKRSSDLQMAAVVPAQHWIKATGPRGTIIFADTRGYHKGGLAFQRDRLLYNCMYTSQASLIDDLFSRPPALERIKNKAQAFALGG